jgi:hypothetical protein
MQPITFMINLSPSADGWDADATVTLGGIQGQILMSYITVERYSAYFTDIKEQLASLRLNR